MESQLVESEVLEDKPPCFDGLVLFAAEDILGKTT
jgi:hypothetical protein